MTEEKSQAIIGYLLHDIGKVIYRQGDKRNHSTGGYDYLKNDAHITSTEILDAVRYHHSSALSTANVAKNSNAYIAWIADNIASASDRRKNDSEDKGFEMTLPIESVFNVLNGNNKKLHYHKGMLGENNSINYPTEEKQEFDTHFYLKVKTQITDNLRGITFNTDYINSLLEILEANLLFVPSSTAKDELADISLYDHMKLTAAVGACIYDYLAEKEITDYKTELFVKSQDFYDKKAFILYSMDVSGIQNFIYTIHSKDALKNLRARSFYLEIMMEHIIDELLDRLELSRANLIYSGGGHCYLLLPNTDAAKSVLREFKAQLNQWLLEKFDISLYVAAGYSECSANDLKNNPEGSYADIYRNISNMISEDKVRRYSAEQILFLNKYEKKDYTRECRICKRLDKLDDDNNCSICASLINFSKVILEADFFTIVRKQVKDSLILPFDSYLISDTKETLKEHMVDDELYIRSYGKNEKYTGKRIATKLFVANYNSGETFEELAKATDGIERIGILRADVDNLGKAFVSGFADKYATLTRTAALSRHLSMFFKYYMNGILENPKYTIKENTKKEKRSAAVVYSGGDDLFIVGAWDDVLELSVDINNAFNKYTEGTLTLSAGIGIYKNDYPIHAIALEVAELEDESKSLPGKNAITFLSDGENHYISEVDKMISDTTFGWDEFVTKVIDEKYQTVRKFLENSDKQGTNFLYNLLELVRGLNDKSKDKNKDQEKDNGRRNINLARYVYLLARMEPGDNVSPEQKENYKEFSKKMYEWIKSDKDRRQLKSAINMYVYSVREKKKEDEE